MALKEGDADSDMPQIEALHAATRQLVDAADREEVASVAVDAATEILDYPFSVLWYADSEADALVAGAVSSMIENHLDDATNAQSTMRHQRGSWLWKAYEAEDSQRMTVSNEQAASDTPVHSGVAIPIGDHGLLTVGTEQETTLSESEVRLVEILGQNIETALSQLEQQQELKRRNKRLEEFASVLSHDLRNPLNVAVGRLELAREETDNEDLELVARALGRTETLIDDLLSLTRQGTPVQETEMVDLAGLATDSWELVQTGEADLRIERTCSLEAAPERLRQLFENLFRNAVDHGGGEVTVTVGGREDGFYVADDGPGVDADNREQIFRKGYTTAEEGTGFGLTIVREIVTAHDWDVRVTESADGGARFDVTGVEVEQ
jgi:signal transduction histidine kinase